MEIDEKDSEGSEKKVVEGPARRFSNHAIRNAKYCHTRDVLFPELLV